MIIPIRCFTCGRVIADKYEWYVAEVAKLQAADKQDRAKKDVAKENPPHFDALHTAPILDKLGLKRYCCRRHMLSQVDMMEII